MATFLNRWTMAACMALAATVLPAAARDATPPAESPLAKFKTPQPPTWPIDQTVPSPFGVQLKDGNMTTQDVEQVHQLGLKWVRRGFTWRAVEKEKGVYDFTKYEQLVADCRDRGMSVIATLGLGNPLYKDSAGKDVHVKDEPAHSAYVAYAAAAAKRFKGQPVIFEIWNEPNVQFWGKYDKSNGPVYAADYTKLCMDTVPAMKRANPDVIVLGGSVSNVWIDSYKWIDSCFKDGILDSGIDAWSLHPYGVAKPEDYLIAYDIVHKSMTDYGKGKQIPFIDSERGFPIGKASEGFAGGEANQQLDYQAWHLVRQYMIDQLTQVKLTSWYEWSGKEGFSLVAGDQHSPAYNACKVMLQQLDGCTLDKRLPTTEERDFVLRWTSKSGAVRLVAWTSPPPFDKTDKKTPHGPETAGSHAIDIPVTDASGGKLKTVDLFGKEASVDVSNGSINLTISGAPVYVTVHE